MDSTAIDVLLAAYKKALQTGGSIVLHGVRPHQMKVMEMTGLTGVPKLHDGALTKEV